MAPLVALTSVHGSFAAHVLAARLTSEGIDVELRGAVGGAYGFTVGDMARVDLYVPEQQMEDARLVLLASEIDAAMVDVVADDGVPAAELGAMAAARGGTWPWLVAVVLLVTAVAVPILRAIAE